MTDGLGERIIKARAARANRARMSQTELARRVGVHQVTVWRWEQKGMIPETQQIERLVRELEVRREWLLDGRGPMTADTADSAEADAFEDPNVLEAIRLAKADGSVSEDVLEGFRRIAPAGRSVMRYIELLRGLQSFRDGEIDIDFTARD